jgi:hypothetical protein
MKAFARDLDAARKGALAPHAAPRCRITAAPAAETRSAVPPLAGSCDEVRAWRQQETEAGR